MIKCTVCIPSYKRPDNLNNLLSAIVAMNDERISEVLIGITDSLESSINTTTEHLLRTLQISNIKYTIESDFNGLLDVKNWFKNTAINDILLVVDDDGLITRKYLDLLINFEDEKLGAISGSLQTPINNGRYKDYSYEKVTNPPKGTICNKIAVEDDLVVIKDKWQVYMFEESMQYECECLVGTAMFIRKKLLNVDLTFDRGACNYEEFDYTYTAYKQGYKLIFDSSRIAFHLHAQQGGMRAKANKLKEINSNYFREKHHV